MLVFPVCWFDEIMDNKPLNVFIFKVPELRLPRYNSLLRYIFNFPLLILSSQSSSYSVFSPRIISKAVSAPDDWRNSLRGYQPMASQRTKHQILIPRAIFKSATAAISQSVTVHKAIWTVVSIGNFYPLFRCQNPIPIFRYPKMKIEFRSYICTTLHLCVHRL
jgi:hypothetical protein